MPSSGWMVIYLAMAGCAASIVAGIGWGVSWLWAKLMAKLGMKEDPPK